MSNEDKFELKAEIRKIERSRTLVLWGYLILLAGVGVLWPSDLGQGGKITSCIVLVVGAVLHREMLNARLDTVRNSFRHVLIARDRSILADPDY